MRPPAYLYPEWEAVLAGIAYGIEAAAQVCLVGSVCFLTLRAAIGIQRWWWRR